MILYLIVILSVVSVTLDLLILRRVRRRLPDKRWLRRLYLAHFLLLDAGIVAALLFYRRCSEAGAESYMHVILWVICLFFMSVGPKSVYMLVSLLDYPAGWVRRKKVRLFSRIGLAAGALTLLVMIWGATVGRSRIVEEDLIVRSDKIPAAFDGYKIVLFTDLHAGNEPGDRRFIRRMVRKINEQHPDLVVNAGDLVNIDARELTDSVMSVLSGIRAKDGVYSVYGNHDLGIYLNRDSDLTPRQSFDELAVRQRAMGWNLLDNESRYVRRGSDSISVTGVNFPIGKKLNGRQNVDFARCDFDAAYRGVPDSLFNLLIAHTPEVWDEALATGRADLTLSGHVHAMQLKIRLGGWAWSPAEWMYDRWSGLYEEDGKYLFVNDGMGYVMYPMRIGTYPSITVITLKSE